MIPWWTLLILLAGFAVMQWAIVRYAKIEQNKAFDLGVEAGAAACRKDALLFNRQRGPRILIDVTDVGEEWGEHRYHWVLWDADKLLLPDQEWGVIRPYREGAAPTQGAAYSQALQAIVLMREETGTDNIHVVAR